MQKNINSSVVRKSILIWLAIIPLAIINGGLRDKILEPLIGSYALPASGIMLCAMIFIITWALLPRLGIGSQKTYIMTGLMWVLLTVFFEFCMGILVSGLPWSKLMDAYNITTGNLWVIVLAFTGLSPWITAKLRHIF